MTTNRKLNLDVGDSISKFEKLMKKFLVRKVLYRIIFRGKGLEFDGYRDFSPIDDANDIDWKASARANKLLVKQYKEERDLKIMFVVDVSENMLFGSTEKLKCEYAAEVCATLAHLIVNSGDKIGFAFFNDKITEIVPPKPGMRQFSIFVDSLSNPLNYGGVSKINGPLDFLLNYLDESVIGVIIVSDFIKVKKDILKTLNLFSSRFDTIALMIKDPIDKTLPKIDREVIIEDPVTKEQLLINPILAKRLYEKNAIEQTNIVKKIFTDAGVDFLELTTDKEFLFPLADFLKERVKKGKFITPR